MDTEWEIIQNFKGFIWASTADSHNIRERPVFYGASSFACYFYCQMGSCTTRRCSPLCTWDTPTAGASLPAAPWCPSPPLSSPMLPMTVQLRYTDHYTDPKALSKIIMCFIICTKNNGQWLAFLCSDHWPRITLYITQNIYLQSLFRSHCLYLIPLLVWDVYVCFFIAPLITVLRQTGQLTLTRYRH